MNAPVNNFDENRIPGNKTSSTPNKKYLKYLPFMIGLIIVVVVGIYLIIQIQKWSQSSGKPKKAIQIISLIQPKPPEPEVEEIPEQKIEETIETLELEQPIPDIPDDVPSKGVAVDAEGSGGDGILRANKGGRGFLGDVDPFSSYKQLISDVLTELLNKNEKINKLEYNVKLKVWVSLNGLITSFRLEKSTGNNSLDKVILAAIPKNIDLGKYRPPGMKKTVTLKISSRK